MAYMLMNFEVDDYEEWKGLFDSDPIDRTQVAKGHMIFRAVDNPKEVFLGVEYPSVEDAQKFRERLMESGVLDRFKPKNGPTVVEVADQSTY